ncbi:hypothetical protein [Pseudonocardia cypriaca]|uniref:hypothetical protein n=1 Tax=Pseudonocardia cypriaca TaxID=882449 RepID=UPI001476BE54|nr:hypothetical protein [Pseudonocardia cypriaca]
MTRTFDILRLLPSRRRIVGHGQEPDLRQRRALKRRIDIDGVEYPYFDQLVWAGLATMPGLLATAIPAGRSPEAFEQVQLPQGAGNTMRRLVAVPAVREEGHVDAEHLGCAPGNGRGGSVRAAGAAWVVPAESRSFATSWPSWPTSSR